MQWFKRFLRVLSVPQRPCVSGISAALAYQRRVQKWVRGGV
jgi:hypothetical protein